MRVHAMVVHAVALCILMLAYSTANEANLVSNRMSAEIAATNQRVQTDPQCRGCLALVTTFPSGAVSEAWAMAFLVHYAVLGFQRIYVFLDDPETDAELGLALERRCGSYLRVVRSTTKYREQWWTYDAKNGEAEQSLLPGFGVFIETEPEAREVLYTVRAGVMARKAGVEWMLPVSHKEMLSMPLQGTIPGGAYRLFTTLNEGGFAHVHIMSDEVMPRSMERNKTGELPFTTDWRFKPNVLLPDAERNNSRSDNLENLPRRPAEPARTNLTKWKYFSRNMRRTAVNMRLYSKALPWDCQTFVFTEGQAEDQTATLGKVQDIDYTFPRLPKVRIVLIHDTARLLNFDLLSGHDLLDRVRSSNQHLFDIDLVSTSKQQNLIQHQQLWVKKSEHPAWQQYQELTQLLVSKTERFTNTEVPKNDSLQAAAQEWIETHVLDEAGNETVPFHHLNFKSHMQELASILQNCTTLEPSDQLSCAVNHLDPVISAANKKVEPVRNYTSCIQQVSPNVSQDLASNFQCDIEHCCGLLKNKAYKMHKRLLGFTWYDRDTWWMPGLTWPGGGAELLTSLRWDKLGVPKDKYDAAAKLPYWEERIESIKGYVDRKQLRKWQAELEQNNHWRQVSPVEAASLLYYYHSKMAKREEIRDSQDALSDFIRVLKEYPRKEKLRSRESEELKLIIENAEEYLQDETATAEALQTKLKEVEAESQPITAMLYGDDSYTM